MSTAEPVAPLVVQLDGGARAAFVRADGSSRFADVAIGRHVVRIPSTALLFGQFQVDVEADGAVRVREAAYVGAPWTAARYPLEAEPVKALEDFDPREKFNVLTLGMNPSFLTIVVPIGLLYVLPKLTVGMGTFVGRAVDCLGLWGLWGPRLWVPRCVVCYLVVGVCCCRYVEQTRTT